MMIVVGGVGSQPAFSAGLTAVPGFVKSLDSHGVRLKQFLNDVAIRVVKMSREICPSEGGEIAHPVDEKLCVGDAVFLCEFREEGLGWVSATMSRKSHMKNDVRVDIDLVMMDREFDSEPVKDTCEEYDVHYLNPTRIFDRSDEDETIAWMYRNGKRFHVTEEETDDGTPTRKQIYLPQQSNSGDDDEEEDGLSDVWTEMCGEWEFVDVEGEPSDGMSFSRLFADIHCEEEVEARKQKAKDGDVDTAGTVVFETNHPYVTAHDADSQEMEAKTFIHMIERVIHRYRHRWGIENGFKKQKHFMVRTTSTERDYRFFNFAFACILYNVWRLVDLLVKLALDGENRTYKPLVDANQFLTVAKQWYGLDPPD